MKPKVVYFYPVDVLKYLIVIKSFNVYFDSIILCLFNFFWFGSIFKENPISMECWQLFLPALDKSMFFLFFLAFLDSYRYKIELHKGLF